MQKDFEILSHIIENVELDIIESVNENPNKIPNWSPSALRSATRIFMDVVGKEMWNMCEKDNIAMNHRAELFEEFGNSLNGLILAATNKNSREFYDTTIVTNNRMITPKK